MPTNKEIAKEIAEKLTPFASDAVAVVLEPSASPTFHRGERQFGDQTLTVEIAGKLVTITIAVETI